MMSAKPKLNNQDLEQANVIMTSPVKDQKKSEHWQIIATTFITVFLAEIGDKTQLSVLVISAQSHQPWVVFAGAAIALVSTSLLGVIAGKWLAKTFSPSLLNTLAGLSFLIL